MGDGPLFRGPGQHHIGLVVGLEALALLQITDVQTVL
jgi:hypothetical protein